MINYKITVITVVKNDEKNIEKTIKSVINQNYNNIEYIVVDGNSTDKTLDKIKKYKKKIKIISKKDKNLWEGINTGIKNSNGQIIGILNSNDVLYKNALKIVNHYFNNNKINFLFGAVKKNKVHYKFEPKKISYRFNIYPSHSCSFFIKSEAQKKLGYYDTNYEYCSDYDMFYRMIVKKKMNGISTKKNELIGKFDLNGISSKLPFYKHYFYEMKVRFNNGQNIIYLMILYVVKILNKFRNKFLLQR
jgi:glycosyltransferase involved in cell wall biosynthesis